MAKLQIVRASQVSQAQLRLGMIAGFSGYAVAMQPDEQAFAFMMGQRGLKKEMSWVALSEDRVIAVWLVSVDGDTGYLIASGTDPDFRGQGIARRLAETALRCLRDRHVRRFQTEVMDGNEAAFALYRSLGMEVERELACFDLSGVAASFRGQLAAGPVSWRSIMDETPACRDWSPTWQNNDAAMERVEDGIHCLGVRDADGLAGYAVLLRATGAIAQIAVRPDRRRAGVGRALIEGLFPVLDGKPSRVLNADASDAGFAAFMTALGAEPMVGQRELACRL